ncbi:MAG TPA: tetratricopeptide repeat protein, partial [Phenylobacterium sp.]|uniref:tetratricopeptide repeat protein n=1 Tax=Phenylobacterium sp. TaxID=1871053 RepID=UPI002F9545EF
SLGGEAPGLGGAAAKSVAVLPFASFAGGADSEYFADGLTEEVTNSLAQVPDLKVAGRTSAFYFKGKNEDVRDIGRKLNVAHVVEGSVRRSGQRLRVTCQLVSVRDGYHLWSETYDRTMDDAFAIQSEIADGVADALKAELKAEGGERGRRARRNPEAYALEVVAKGQVRRMGKAQIQSAQAIYRQLIDMEPDNAEAHAGYAFATAYLVQNHLEGDFLPAVRQAEAEIDKALKLDPKSSSAYIARGLLSVIRFIRESDQEAERTAEASYRRAVELDPRNPEALSLYGDFMAGRDPKLAIPYLRRALDIDPLDRIANNALAGALVAIDRPAEAEQRYRANTELFPDYVDSKEQLGDLMVEIGRLDEAVAWYRLAAQPQTDPAASIALANAYYNLGMPAEAEAAVEPWKAHPVVGGVVTALKLLVAGDFQGLMALSRAELAKPQADPLWRAGVQIAGAQLGEYEAAREQFLITSPELFEPRPQVSARLANEITGAAYVIARTGDQGQAQRILQATLEATAPKPGLRQPTARRIARVKAYAMLGDNERAIAELRAAVDAGYRQLVDIDGFMRLDAYPMVAPLRADPRFKAQIARIEADNARMRQKLLTTGAPTQVVAP